jgi:NAD(P)-dependent dehydrogenase (short-subunit alcohol dehydrogenase family)
MMDLYDASKWGVLGLTIAWSKALKEHNIRVNAFSMGATDSQMIRGFVGDAVTPEMITTWMRPEDVCDLAIQLIREGPLGRTAENIGVWLDFEIELKANPTPKPLAASA